MLDNTIDLEALEIWKEPNSPYDSQDHILQNKYMNLNFQVMSLEILIHNFETHFPLMQSPNFIYLVTYLQVSQRVCTTL